MRAGLLVLTGFNVRAVIALCRWSKAAGVPLHAVARNPQDTIYLTDYAPCVFAERSSDALDAAETAAWVERLRTDHGYDRVVIAPSTEYFNRFLLRNRDVIEAAGGIIPLVDAPLYAQVSDKQTFGELCTAHGIAVPAELQGVPEQLPFVAKPKHYGAATSGQIKPYLVCTPADRAHFLDREDPSNFFFQELVEGRSIYLLAHVARDGGVTACAQENLMQQSRGRSMILARPHDFHLEPEADRYLAMLRAIGFHGLIMIEVRRSDRTGRAVMIEANPRMWGPLQFTLDQGVDLFAPLLADHGVALPNDARTSERRPYYFWAGGLSRDSQPYAFHNYSSRQFLDEYPQIGRSDLFARDDSRRLHAHELTLA